MLKQTRRKKIGVDAEVSRFTAENLEATAKMLKSGKLPLQRTSIGDDMVTGLRAIIYKTGEITFHALYTFGEGRPFLKLGTYPDMSIDEARELTKTIRALADKGIDVQDGLHKRLIAQLQKDGVKWRP